MGMLKNDSDVFEFLGAISTAESIEAYEAFAVPFLSKTFKTQSVIAISYRRGSEPNILFRWIPDETLRLKFDQDYGKIGFLLDPYMQCSWDVDNWAVFPLRQIAPDRFETSDYFRAYFGATKMVDEVGFISRIADDISVSLSLGRNSGEKRFRASEVARFHQLCHVLAPKIRQITTKQPPQRTEDISSLEHRFLALSKERNTSISPREAEVAALIVRGHSSRAIGLILEISGHTVKVHRRSLYRKLSISSQNELFSLFVGFSSA